MPASSSDGLQGAEQASNRRTPDERLGSLGLVRIGPASEHIDEIRPHMSRTPLFSGLTPEEAGKLGEFMSVYDAPPGVTVIQEGDVGDFMMLLMSGMVDVLRRNRYDYPARIAVAHAGHALGEMSTFDGEPRFASCVTLEPCRFAVLTREALLRVISDQPTLGNKILLKLVQMLSDRLRQTSAKLVSYLEASREGWAS